MLQHLNSLMQAMPEKERLEVEAALRDWEALKVKHGDAGMFAFALAALAFNPVGAP